MGTRLADRLHAARRSQFVGRHRERSFFRSALETDQPPFYVLHIFGPGGVGKTTLLQEFAWLAREAGWTPIYLDVRNIEHAPISFIAALQGAMKLAPTDDPVETMAASGGRYVLLLDTCEQLGPLDDWLRDQFLPQLPESTLVVLAGRNPPALAWRADPGWQPLMQTLPLRNLSREESRSYLNGRHVSAEQHRAVLGFTHGHPLALSLIADLFDQQPNFDFQPDEAPDVIKTLLECFVEEVPSPAHRMALELCALVRLTTEALLAAALEESDVHPLFEWLRGLSFINADKGGLFPHDLVREALTADLRWRNPDRYVALHNRVRTYYAARLEQSSGREQRRVLLDYNYLHRDSPTWKPFLDWENSGVWTDVMQPDDQAALVAMVRAHEGDSSARLAAQWLARFPQAAIVFRDGEPLPAGFMLLLPLHELSTQEAASDPATRAALAFLQEQAPLRVGEKATHVRFWMARSSYQAVSATQTRVFLNATQHYLTTPGLAFSFFPCAEPDFWAPAFGYIAMRGLPEAAFEVGGRRYGVFGHDWRVVPPVAWLAVLAEREMGVMREAVPPPPTVEPLVVLSESAFAHAVRDALRDYSRPLMLNANLLTRSRLVLDEVGTTASDTERVAALRRLLKEAADSLQSSPRDVKLYRALYHTYFQPALTQEQAAELLDLPLSTFRRHLKNGVQRLTDLLWQREIGGRERVVTPSAV